MEGGGLSAELLESISRKLPLKVKESVKILGVTFDATPCFEQQAQRVLVAARTRLAILGTAAGSSWGLEVEMLRLTYKALMVSLPRHALPIVGSGVSENRLLALEKGILDAAARRILGVGRSARIMFLHAAAWGSLSAQYVLDELCVLPGPGSTGVCELGSRQAAVLVV